MKNGKLNGKNEWFSYTAYKKLFEEALKDTKKGIGVIKSSLMNHLTDGS